MAKITAATNSPLYPTAASSAHNPNEALHEHPGKTENVDRDRNNIPSPYFPEVGVLALVPDIWGGPWQVRQHVLTRLARYFYVVWCDAPRSWRAWQRHALPQNSNIDNGASRDSRLEIYHPANYLPEVGRPRFLSQWTERKRLRRARRILQDRGCRKTILYIWQPRYQCALDLITYHLSCYHIDDEYTFSEVDKPISDQERQLIERVDQVFIHSPALLEKKGKLNPQTAFVPNGADYEAYAASRQEPSDLSRIPGPRIGYTGRIKPQLDWPLIARLTSQHPEWSFVFVGPQTSHLEIPRIVQELSNYRNVYFLGAKSVQELSAYPQHFDVCIMPYQLNDYTKYIYPVKLHEYLASGRPVVGTPLRSLAEFGNVIKLVRTTDEWSEALRHSLRPAATSCEQVEARRNIARHHDWNRLVRLIAHTMCERLGPLYLERLQKISAVSEAAFAN